MSDDIPHVWWSPSAQALVVGHRFGGCYDMIHFGNTGATTEEELSELPDDAVHLLPASGAARVTELERELEKLRPGGAEPVMAPTAMDASADRWLTYAAGLEAKLGDQRARVAELTEALEGAVEALGWASDYISVDWPKPYRVENFRAALGADKETTGE